MLHLRISLMVLVLAVAVVSGCVRPDAAFVKSMDTTYKAVAPEYEAYVRNDTKMNVADKQIRINTITQWRDTVDEAMRH